MASMRQQEKWIITFALILVFLGIIAIAISRDLVVTINDDGNTTPFEIRSTTDIPISFGANIKRYYDEGEVLSVWYAWGRPPSIVLDSFSYNFKIITPQGEENIFEFRIRAQANPNDPTSHIVYPDELTIWNLVGLVIDNASRQYDFDFVAKTLSSGNYTLVYTSNYTASAPVPRLTRMALGEVTSSKDYPYTLLLPFGIGFVITGTVVSSWIFVVGSNSSIHSKCKR